MEERNTQKIDVAAYFVYFYSLKIVLFATYKQPCNHINYWRIFDPGHLSIAVVSKYSNLSKI